MEEKPGLRRPMCEYADNRLTPQKGVVMAPRVDPKLHLSPNGRTVTVTGPIDGGWDPDEAAAVFTVVISQTNGAGIVTAIGASATYEPAAARWTATATITNGTPLHVGNATAHAYATIAQPSGGAESYPWTVPTELVAV